MDEDDGEDVDPAKFYEARVRAVAAARAAGQNPSPHKFETTLSLPGYVEKFQSALEPGQQEADQSASLAGRVYAKRAQGKLVFFDLKADGVKVQVMADARNFGCGVEGFPAAISAFKRGDIVGVDGFPGELGFFLFVVVAERKKKRKKKEREREKKLFEKNRNSLFFLLLLSSPTTLPPSIPIPLQASPSAASSPSSPAASPSSPRPCAPCPSAPSPTRRRGSGSATSTC